MTAYPYAPGYKDRDTSRLAAEAIGSRVDILRARVLMLLERFPEGLTADECAGMMQESVLAVRPRMSELIQQGMVVDSKRRRLNQSGRTAKVLIRRKNP